MSTMVWCNDCERNEVVCECVDNPVRDNACYELEQSEKCTHTVEKFLDTYTCQECGVVEPYGKAYEVGGIVDSKLICRSCLEKEKAG